MAVVRLGSEVGLLDSGAFGLERCVGVPGPRLVPGAGEEGAGGLEVGWLDGGLLGVEGAGVGVGCRDGDGAGEDVGGAGVGVFPVPLACLFWPWWRYSSIPSRCRPSPKLKADDNAKRAKKARSHEFRNMLGAVMCRNRNGNERMWTRCRVGSFTVVTRFTKIV